MDINNLKKKNIGFVSLGCDKNRVDLEKMIYNLKMFGFNIVSNPIDANIIIVNTCSFIEIARTESINTILEMSGYKKYKLEKLIVTGCINNMNYTDLEESLPEVDLFVKPENNSNIINLIAELYNVSTNENFYDTDRILTTPIHFAYLKIADGCNNFCSYCTIPTIRGRYKSVPLECLITEATKLVNFGVKELILVAQDVTKYGIDLYSKKSLVRLIRELSKIDGLERIRLLYCYPNEIDEELIDEIKNNPKVVKYLDIPLQHVSTRILKLMNRRETYEDIINLINYLKAKIPIITLRTTFIVGLPTEDEEDFKILCDFIKLYKIDNVGFFKYSREDGTRAYDFKPQIPEKIKNYRLKVLSNIQYEIAKEKNSKYIGKQLDVIIDEFNGTQFIGRILSNCPIVDPIVFVSGVCEIGKIYKVKITKCKDYDLEGEIL